MAIYTLVPTPVRLAANGFNIETVEVEYKQGSAQKVLSTNKGCLTNETYIKFMEAVILGNELLDMPGYYEVTFDQTKIKDFSIHDRINNVFEEIKLIENGVPKENISLDGAPHVPIFVAHYDPTFDQYDLQIYLDYIQGNTPVVDFRHTWGE